MKSFETETRLPFLERPDLSPFIVHLTKASATGSAFDNLLSILEDGEIHGSSKTKGFIKGPNKATCFMDIPLHSLKYVINKSNTDRKSPRYGSCGILVSKNFAYNSGARPVLYLSGQELSDLKIPTREHWRVVRFEGVSNQAIGWSHEREWRIKGNLKLPPEPLTVFVKNSVQASKLAEVLKKAPERFKAVPRSIIPLNILCQGLPYLS